MEKNTTLTISETSKKNMAELIQFNSLNELKDYYSQCIDSGMLPSSIQTPEAALVIAQMGSEIGLPPLVSWNNISVIQGRPVLGWAIQVGIVQKKGVIVNVTKDYEAKKNAKGEFTGNFETEVEIMRWYEGIGWKTFKFSKSWNQCAKAGWTKKDNWLKLIK